MKTRYQLALAAVVVALMGCERSQQAEAERTVVTRDTNVAAYQMREKVRDAVDATKNYAAQNKDQFVASMETKMKELDRKIDELSSKGETLAADAKSDANKALDSLREERTQLRQKFDELKKSSQDTWKDVKAGCESAMKELEKAFDNAKAKFGG